MAGSTSRVVYRKDERGVITDSKVIGSEDKIPEGYEAEGQYVPIETVQTVEVTTAESKLTPWESVKDEPSVTTEASEQMNDGTPRQAREQAGGDLTEAEKEADQLIEDEAKAAAEAAAPVESEVNEGSPRQAREQSDEGELTGAEEETDEASSEEKAPRRNRRNS